MQKLRRPRFDVFQILDSWAAQIQHKRESLPLPAIPTEIVILVWVLGLWQWGLLLNQTSATVDLVILAITGLPAVLLFWARPEYGLIALMFFASGFLGPDFVDIRLPVGGGLEMRDILLLLMFGLTFFQRLSRRDLTLPWWPVGGLLAAFLAIAIFSTFNALFFENVAFNWIFSDLRILLFYLIFFITAWSVIDERSLYTAVIGTFIIADISAIIIFIQQFYGPSTYVLESMADGSWAIYPESGAVRVLPPGIVHMYFMMLMSVGFMVFLRHDRKKFLFWTAHTGMLGISLLLTFTRSSWIASGIALGLITLILLPKFYKHLPRVLVLGAATAMLVVGVLGMTQSNSRSVEIPLVGGIVERFTSIFTVGETLETNSLQWRLFELQEASEAIAEHPLTGVGLGNSYRNITVFQGEAQGLWTDGDISFERIDRFTRYAHSSYLAITVKMGIPALIIFLSFCFAAIIKGLALYYKLPEGFAKGVVLVVGPGMIGLLQWSTFHAQLMLAGSTPVIGLVIGLLASINYIYVLHDPQDSDTKLKATLV